MSTDVKSAVRTAAPPPLPTAAAAAQSIEGIRIGSYEILDRLGGGGMGEVYRARHTRIGRLVAIKVLKENLPNRREASRRFLEEARAVNNIGHPNIIDIYDFVELKDREPPVVFLVMELLEGTDLSEYMEQRGPLEFDEAVAITREVANALYAVHERGLLHRDLKPGNIFLTPQPHGPPRVTVLDFGAIKPIAGGEDLALTGPGMAVGTPWYMAPEQVMDKGLDRRTDIYSLGVVLYRMLTGKVPFEDASLTKLMVLIARSRPPPPSAVRGEPIPPKLEAVVTCCLQKKPDDRYEDMTALQRALDDCGLPIVRASEGGKRPIIVSASPANSEPDETRAIRNALPRPRWLLPAGIAAVLLIVSGLLVLLWPSGQPRQGAAAKDAGSGEAPPAIETDADVDDATRPHKATKHRRRVRRPRRRPRRVRARRSKKKAGSDKPANLKIVDPFKK